MKKSEIQDIIREEIENLNESGWIMSPEQMIGRSLMSGLLNSEEAKSSKVKKAAKETAEDLRGSWPEGEGFGSSDGTAYIKYMLDDAGYKTDYVKGWLIRKDIDDERKVAGKMVKGRYSESVNEVDIYDNSQNAQTMEKDIEKISKKYFPKSYIDVYFSKNILPHITIVFAIGQKKEWSNGIFENDPLATKLMISHGFDDQGNITGKMEFDPLYTSLTLKAPEGSHLAYGRVKVGARKKKGDYNAIMKGVELTFAKMKKAVKDNINNLDDNHQWVKKYV